MDYGILGAGTFWNIYQTNKRNPQLFFLPFKDLILKTFRIFSVFDRKYCFQFDNLPRKYHLMFCLQDIFLKFIRFLIFSVITFILIKFHVVKTLIYKTEMRYFCVKDVIFSILWISLSWDFSFLLQTNPGNWNMKRCWMKREFSGFSCLVRTERSWMIFHNWIAAFY